MLARGLVASCPLDLHLGDDLGLGGVQRGGVRVDLGAERGALLLEVGDGGVERLAHLHELELTVLDRALVLAELLDVGLHRLQLLRRADLARVHAALDLFGLVGQRAGFVVELLLLARDLVALGAVW